MSITSESGPLEKWKLMERRAVREVKRKGEENQEKVNNR